VVLEELSLKESDADIINAFHFAFSSELLQSYTYTKENTLYHYRIP
jgi:hypothetical protein